MGALRVQNRSLVGIFVSAINTARTIR